MRDVIESAVDNIIEANSNTDENDLQETEIDITVEEVVESLISSIGDASSPVYAANRVFESIATSGDGPLGRIRHE